MPRRISHSSSSREKCRAMLKRNDVLSEIEGMTPQEIARYVNQNVKSVPDMKRFLIMLLLQIEANK